MVFGILEVIWGRSIYVRVVGFEGCSEFIGREDRARGGIVRFINIYIKLINSLLNIGKILYY